MFRVTICNVLQTQHSDLFKFLIFSSYELIKLNHFRGLSLSIVQLFSKQVIGCWSEHRTSDGDHICLCNKVCNMFALPLCIDIAWISTNERCWYNSL